MVDDPSEYVDVLLSDPATKRAAVRALKKRRAKHAVSPATGGGNAAADTGLNGTAGPAGTPGTWRRSSKRERLFGILEELVLWENTTNEALLERARTEIWQSWRRACAEQADHPRAAALFDRHTLPAFHDPFAGGGLSAARSAAAGPRGARQRSEPGGGADQQGDDRDPAEVRRPAAGEPGDAERADPGCQDVEGRAGAGRRRAPLRPLDARRRGEADRASVSAGQDHARRWCGSDRT